ncbi:MAG: potassium/proton antiporter [Ignavibacteriaceae bacterium]
MITIDYVLLIGATLILISIITAKLLDNIGIPTLLLFIGVGIAAGSEGLGGISFNDPALAQSIGIVALLFILFSSGLDTDWKESKTVFLPALSLATFGVIATAVIVALFVMLIFETPFLWSLLIGAIISSTDAAAVFAVLRMGNISLKGKIKPLLELESGSNDPMAVFLTIGIIELLLTPEKSSFSILILFFQQIGLGAIIGLAGGKMIVYFINKLNFSYEGIYPVFSLALAVIVYSLTAVFGGSGFLAIYIAGLILGNSQMIQKRALIRFFDGLAVLSQIAMFLTLGLLVFPSNLIYVIGSGLLLSFILIFVARPISVFISLLPFGYTIKEKLLVSWVGLRGAVPIVLATFPLLYGIERSYLIFNVVFFVVITSSLLQGWSLNVVAKWLGLSLPFAGKKKMQLEFSNEMQGDTDIVEIIVPGNSDMIGKQIVDLNFPEDTRIILIVRDNHNIVPSGSTLIEEGDILTILINKQNTSAIHDIISSTH